jgi:beta-lactamase regulating signal transducer with metallopeptidase domain
MAWVVGPIVVVVVLIVIARRRNRRDPSYDETTQARIDDHQSRQAGEQLRPLRRRLRLIDQTRES